MDKPIIENENSEKKDIVPAIISGVIMAGGLAVFIIYLIKYIKSFSDYNDGGAYGYDFDPDSMLIFILGLFLVILGINALVAFFLKKFSYLKTSIILTSIVFASLIKSLYKL